MIVIVDYGMGNLGSLQNIFRRIGADARIEADPAAIASADKLVLPGVGAFDAAMQRIGEVSGLRETLDRMALVSKVPVLGVCLGMQLLTDGSEEGRLPGLGWIGGAATRFPRHPDLKVPHMGWNTAVPSLHHPLTEGLVPDARYYFVHSYYVRATKAEHSLLKTTYQVEFDAGIASENIFGLQFHPEKSHHFGMAILRNFARM